MTVNTWIGSSHLHFNPVTTPSPTESMAQDESSQKSVTCTAGAFVVSQNDVPIYFRRILWNCTSSSTRDTSDSSASSL